MDEGEGERVGVTLFPADYETVAMVTEQGDEVLQEDFTDAQLFVHAIQELERVRAERSKKKKKKKKAKGKRSGGGDSPDAVDLKEEIDEGGDVVMKEEGEPKKDEKTEGGTEEEEEEEDEDEEVIDPRIYYRPMVSELQSAVVELHQLINSIDLIRRRDFLEEMRCIRENTAPKKEELEYLVESKGTQIKEANRILLDGVEALTATVEKESVFFQGVTQILRKWKLIAPIHGNIPKPFRAGEPLAVDCSYVSAGSTFVPMTRSIADVTFAELCRTEKGLVRIKVPDDFMLRTIQVGLELLETGKSGCYTLPLPTVIDMSKAEMDRLTNSAEDRKVLEERNSSILKAVQFSIFNEEMFYTAMREALQSSSNWTDTAFNASNYTSSIGSAALGGAKRTISVLQVLDDELKFRVNEKYQLTLRLVDAKSLSDNTSSENEAIVASEDIVDADITTQDLVDMEPVIDVKVEGVGMTTDGLPSSASSPARHSSKRLEPRQDPLESDEAFLTQTCRYSVSLLQQEMRQHHGRKEITRALMYNSENVTNTSSQGGSLTMASTAGPSQADVNAGNAPGSSSSSGVLSTVLDVIAHNLLKDEVTKYLDDLSRVLALQKMQVSSTGRVLDDGLMQPICDSVRGIYVGVRWKTCAYESTLAAFDLSIGKNFTTEVLISGTRVQLQSSTASSSANAAACQEVAGLAGLRAFVESAVCAQVALAIYRDALSLGVKQASTDLDRASVRIFSAGEWDGSCIGDGRVSDSRAVGFINFEPYIAPDKILVINCTVQAIDAVAALDGVVLLPAGQLETTSALKRSSKFRVDWARIPSTSDVSKLSWLLQRTKILPSMLLANGPVHVANGTANGIAIGN